MRVVEKSALSGKRHALSAIATSLDALSPLKVLARGYAIVQKGENIVRSVAELTPGDMLQLQLADGQIDCQVTHRKGNEL